MVTGVDRVVDVVICVEMNVGVVNGVVLVVDKVVDVEVLLVVTGVGTEVTGTRDDDDVVSISSVVVRRVRVVVAWVVVAHPLQSDRRLVVVAAIGSDVNQESH